MSLGALLTLGPLLVVLYAGSWLLTAGAFLWDLVSGRAGAALWGLFRAGLMTLVGIVAFFSTSYGAFLAALVLVEAAMTTGRLWRHPEARAVARTLAIVAAVILVVRLAAGAFTLMTERALEGDLWLLIATVKIGLAPCVMFFVGRSLIRLDTRHGRSLTGAPA